MNNQETRLWQCPGCLKTYRIPDDRLDPDLCQDCERPPATPPPPPAAKERERSAVFQGVLVLGICIVLVIAWLASPNAEIDEQIERSKGLTEESLELQDRRTDQIIEEPEVERDWVAVGEWQGSGPKTTEKFQSENGELLITWAARAGEFAGDFSMFIEGQEFDLAANQFIQESGSDSTRFHGSPGTYYLKINTVNVSWAVSVSDWR